MARLDDRTEYIIHQADYHSLLAELPATAAEGDTYLTKPVTAREYRLNVSQTINAGKWSMWGIAPESFVFTYQNGAWQPPANVVIRRD